MINGPGVLMKYNVIVEARRKELQVSKTQNHSGDQLLEFIHTVRNGTREEFEEWYNLYK